MRLQVLLFVLLGIIVGILSSFSGLGGGFLIVPLLLFLGYDAQKAVGTSFMAIVIISLSALFAHSKLQNVDYKLGILLGMGGIIGAQIGARVLEHIPTPIFKKIFAAILILLALRIFFQK